MEEKKPSETARAVRTLEGTIIFLAIVAFVLFFRVEIVAEFNRLIR